MLYLSTQTPPVWPRNFSSFIHFCAPLRDLKNAARFSRRFILFVHVCIHY